MTLEKFSGLHSVRPYQQLETPGVIENALQMSDDQGLRSLPNVSSALQSLYRYMRGICRRPLLGANCGTQASIERAVHPQNGAERLSCISNFAGHVSSH